MRYFLILFIFTQTVITNYAYSADETADSVREKSKVEKEKEAKQNQSIASRACQKYINNKCGYTECLNNISSCDGLTEELTNYLQNDTILDLSKNTVADEDNTDDEGNAIVRKKTKDELSKDLKERNNLILNKIKNYTKINKKNSCGTYTPKATAQLLASQYDKSKEKLEDAEKESSKLKEKIDDLARDKDKEAELTDQIQKNNAKIQEINNNLQDIPQSIQLKFQALKDKLDADFAVQNTKINDLKNAAAQIDYELDDKNDSTDESCADEADKRTQAYRDKWNLRQQAYQNTTTLSGALGSASVGGASGEDNYIYQKYYGICIARKKSTNAKAKAQRDALIKKQSIINELNRAVIEAGRIQNQMKQLVESTKVELSSTTKKLTAERSGLQAQVQNLMARLQQLTIANANKAKNLTDELEKKEIEKVLYKADVEELDPLKSTLKVVGSKDSISDTEEKKHTETIDAIRNVAAEKEQGGNCQDVEAKDLAKELNSNKTTR